MKVEIRKLFPEIEQIRDRDLQDRVVTCWEEAMEKGGWKIEDLKSIPFTLLIPDCSINIIVHTRAVTQSAIKMAGVLKEFYKDEVDIDSDLLIAGAILHDVGKILEYARIEGKVGKSRTGMLLRHPFSGAALAYKNGLPEEVIHMIATHAREGDGGYRTTEAVIIHYADFINYESLGGKI
jgi:putative nucleotidyltransferase with HDIG domain